MAMPDDPSSDVSAVDSFLREVAAVSEPEAGAHPWCPQSHRRRLSHDSPANRRLEAAAGGGAVWARLDAPSAAPVHRRDVRVRAQRADGAEDGVLAGGGPSPQGGSCGGDREDT